MIGFRENEIFKNIVKKLDELTQEPDKYAKHYEIKAKQAESEIELYNKFKDMASLGTEEAKEYLIGQYVKFIQSNEIELDEQNISKVIDFEDIQKNDVQIIFEMLLWAKTITEMIDEYKLPYTITEDHIREIAKNEEEKLKDLFKDNIKQVRLIAQFAYATEYGQGCTDSLPYPRQGVNEVGNIGKDYVFVKYKGDFYHLEFLHYNDATDIENIQKKITRKAVKQYEKQNPIVTASKLNSNRVTVAGYDATPDEEDFFITERIFNLKLISLDEMETKYHTIDRKVNRLLKVNQKGKGSAIVSGAGMAIGKSTFLLALINEIEKRWGVGIIDTQNELQAFKRFFKNIMTLIENERMTIPQLFEHTLKMARDAIMVGEINKPEEAGELLNAALRLDAMAGGSLHSYSGREVVPNLRNLVMRTPMYNNSDVAEADIARGLDLIVHMARHPVDRKRIVVETVSEIEYIEQNVEVDLRLGDGFKKVEKVAKILDLIQIALKKYINRKCYRYNEIFRYDPKKDIWIAKDRPSDVYIQKISRFVEENEIEEILSFFPER